MKHDGSQVFEPHSLGERIAHERRRLALREGRDILPPQLAQLLDVSGESVYKWEAGGTVPSRSNIQRMAALFLVSPAYLEYGVVSADGTPERVVPRRVESREDAEAEVVSRGGGGSFTPQKSLEELQRTKKPAAKKASRRRAGGEGKAG